MIKNFIFDVDGTLLDWACHEKPDTEFV